MFKFVSEHIANVLIAVYGNNLTARALNVAARVARQIAT